MIKTNIHPFCSTRPQRNPYDFSEMKPSQSTKIRTDRGIEPGDQGLPGPVALSSEVIRLPQAILVSSIDRATAPDGS